MIGRLLPACGPERSRPIAASHHLLRSLSRPAPFCVNAIGAQRQRDVEAAADVEPEEVRRRHADDVELDALEADGLLQHRRRAAEFALPVGVAEHRARRAAAGSIVFRE